MVFRLHNNGIDMNFLFNFMLLIRLADFFWKIGGSPPFEKCKPTHFFCQTLPYPLNSEGLTPVTLRKKREK